MAQPKGAPPIKRYRREELKDASSDDEWNVEDSENKSSKTFVPYVRVKERRKQNLVKLGRITEIQAAEDDLRNRTMVNASTDSGASSAAEDIQEGIGIDNKNNSDMDKKELVRKQEEILAKSKDTSLLLQHSKLKKIAEARQESELDKQLKEEEKILKSVAENTALMSAAELAKGIQYVDPIKTSWKPPSRILAKSEERHDRIRKQQSILVEGENPPPPLTTFEDMKFHRGIIKGIFLFP